MTKAAKPAEKEPLLYLKQVRIQKHAPILDAKVDFKPGLNIIIGSNGAGKTRFVSLAGQSARIDALPTEDSLNCELLFGYYRDIEVSFHSDGRIGGSSSNSYLTSSKAPNVRVEMFVMPRVRYKGEAQWDDQCLSLGIPFKTLEINTRKHVVIMADYGSPLQHMPLVDDAASLIFNSPQENDAGW